MNCKNNRRNQMTKRILRESLLEMLETENIQKISIRALCEKANVNRSTFYKYYGSQFDLLTEMEDDLLTRIENSFGEEDNPNEDLRSMTAVLRFIQNNISLCKILINSNVDPEFPKRLLSMPMIIKKLDMGAKVRQSEAVYIQECILYGGYQMLRRWINDDCRESAEEMARILNDIFRRIRG